MKRLGRAASSVVTLALLLPHPGKGAWAPIGPFGGDARALAADPRNPDRMYVGTRTGQVYLSTDGGRQWSRLTSLRAPAHWVVDHLATDPASPQILYAGMWSLNDGGGGVFQTTDGGRSWKSLAGIQGQSVRALALAPSNSGIIVVGTLEGVFRSLDSGARWQRISPVGHAEIRNVESVAIDPENPDIIYAGTWHLPWKTTDGGAHWVSIKKGMIDDSDVFSMAVDAARPQTLYATACTGIYRSDTAGAQWRRIHGIPTSSRRTHTLVLDPRDSQILYAGTTEGLWRTRDGGGSWQRLTSHTWTINAVVLDPREAAHFYIGMDHAGVMETWDGGKTFRGANWGYSQRQVSRIVADPHETSRVYVGLLHDGEFGGVFTTNNRGASWQQLSAGLGGKDVLSLLLATQPSWRLLAGTSGGVYEYAPERPIWQNKSRWEIPAKGSGTDSASIVVRDLFQRSAGDPIYAATSAGLFESADGTVWKRLPLESAGGVYAVASYGETGEQLLATTSVTLLLSRDGGRNWTRLRLNGDRPIRVRKIAPHPKLPALVFAGTELGLFRSADGGTTWQNHARGLPQASISDVFFSPTVPGHVLVSGGAGAFFSVDAGNWYARLGNADFTDGLPMELSGLQLVENFHIVAASLHNGVFLHDGSEIPLPGTLRPPR